MRHVEVGILAGGRGTRMRNGSSARFSDIPKVFLPLAVRGRIESLLFHVLTGVLGTHPGAVSILGSRHPESGPDRLVQHVARLPDPAGLTLLWEDTALGTAGALYQAALCCRFPVLAAIPADTAFPFSQLAKAVRAHDRSGAEATWVVTTEPGEDAQNAGRLLARHEDRRLLLSTETPAADGPQVTASPGTFPATSTGVVLFRTDFYRRAFQALTRRSLPGRPTDLYRDLMPFLLGQGHRVAVFDVRQPAPDLGTPGRFTRFELSARWRGQAWPV
jgi:NDP-sugar pyrophosphorylase family protein